MGDEKRSISEIIRNETNILATLPVNATIHLPSEEFEARVEHMAPDAPTGWARLLYRYADDAGLAADVLACLAMKETGRFRYGGREIGYSADPTFFNYGGIKTNDSKATFRFPTMALGIRGLVSHVCWYHYPLHINSVCGRYDVTGYGSTEFDPRHWAWGHRNPPKLLVISDFGNGVWNTTPTYSEGLVRLLQEFWS